MTLWLALLNVKYQFKNAWSSLCWIILSGLKQKKIRILWKQGLLKDAVEIEKRHKENICDGEWFYPCKKSKTLSNVDFKTTLLECTSEIRSQKNYFESLCTWGASVILLQWNSDQKDKIFKLTIETESQDGLNIVKL